MTRERLGTPLVVGGLTITPVERVSLRHRVVAGRLFVSASKRPVAIVVHSGERQWRIELGEPAS